MSSDIQPEHTAKQTLIVLATIAVVAALAYATWWLYDVLTWTP